MPVYKSYHGSDRFEALRFYWPFEVKGCPCWAKFMREYLARRKDRKAT